MLERKALEEKLADEICHQLENDIAERGSASLLVSGGSTPKGLFQVLSERPIAWDKVFVTLVDERFVPDDHNDQNGSMVKAQLLQANASSARFIPLVYDASSAEKNLEQARSAVAIIPRPFTVVVLGMGGDGHTASLFPESPQLDEGMSTDEALIKTEPITAPHERITFSRAALLETKKLVLHCYGEEKKQILTNALQQSGYRPYPIGGFHGQEGQDLEIYWTK